MSNALEIDGNTFLPAAEAGRLFGYSSDYIAKLAREAKVEARKIESKWYVSPASVKFFAEQIETNKVKRAEEIRRERKLEQYQFQKTQPSAPLKKLSALAQTGVIAVLGLVVGVSGYLTLDPGSAAVSQQEAGVYSAGKELLQGWATSLYSLISPKPKLVEEHVTTTETFGSVGAPTEPRQVVSNAAEPRGLFVFGETIDEAEYLASLEATFSDEVEITLDPDDPSRGTVVPIFRERTGEIYHFVTIPLATPTIEFEAVGRIDQNI